VSLEMAFRLAKASGSALEMWQRLQMAYDLVEARNCEDEIVGRVTRVGLVQQND
jgi:plasmid maintenance system antidote protein VapI